MLIYNNYNSVCYLWGILLCKKLLCVPWVLWEYSSPTDYTDQHRWLLALILPRNSQNSQKFGCVSGCVGMAGCHTLLQSFCAHPCYLWETFLYKKLLCVPRVLWKYSSPTDCADSHRWLVALVAAWVRQDAIPSYICVNLCYLWETLLCKKLLWVPCVLWEYSTPTDYTDQHRWLVALVRPRNPQNSQKFGCVSGCVGIAGCHTLLNLCKSVLSVGDPSLQEASVRSVGSVGIQFSHGLH